MRGMRRLTLVPSLRVATSSATGTGLSDTAYFGFAIERNEYTLLNRQSRFLGGFAANRYGYLYGRPGRHPLRDDNVHLIQPGDTGCEAAEYDLRLLSAHRHHGSLLRPREIRRGGRRPAGRLIGHRS